MIRVAILNEQGQQLSPQDLAMIIDENYRQLSVHKRGREIVTHSM